MEGQGWGQEEAQDGAESPWWGEPGAPHWEEPWAALTPPISFTVEKAVPGTSSDWTQTCPLWA